MQRLGAVSQGVAEVLMAISDEIAAVSDISPLDDKQVEIHRQDKNKEILDNPSDLSGESILPGLTVSLEDIFD